MTENSSDKFTWPSAPSTAVEFERLMQAVDAILEQRGLPPFQRDMHVPRLFWEAFGWGGNLFPDAALAKLPGFQGDVLFAKARDWYKQVYGDRMNSEMSPGGVPVRLGNALWRLRYPLVFGTVTFTLSRHLSKKTVGNPSVQAGSNMLEWVEGLTPALAERLDDPQLEQFAQFFLSAFKTLIWRDSLPDTPLFEMARKDYDASTADLLGRRYGQARWGAQQAVEKSFKAVLQRSGIAFPTGGPNGHNLPYLAQQLKTHLGVAFDTGMLDAAQCSPAVRYNEEPSNEWQVLNANHAVLGLWAVLRDDPSVAAALNKPLA
ncbi:MAG: HEPN domain-containing protein [Rhodoferax sp.]|nr:HEPN domain-containing protein [Rhodoferax sp.]